MLITVTSPKLAREQGHQNQSRLEENGSLLFDGGVDIVPVFREDGHDKCWRGLYLPLTFIARGVELLWQGLAIDKASGETTHTCNNPLARFPSHDRRLGIDSNTY